MLGFWKGPLVVPGQYTIELSTGSHHERQTLVVSADPRAKASPADLVAQFELASRLVQGLSASFDGYQSLAALRATIAERVKSFGDAPGAKNRVATLQGFDRRVDAIQNGTNAAPGLGPVNREMARLYSMVESGDARPSEPLSASANEWCGALTKALDAWRRRASARDPRRLARAARARRLGHSERRQAADEPLQRARLGRRKGPERPARTLSRARRRRWRPPAFRIRLDVHTDRSSS